MAAMSVANIVKTSLGPVGLDKMLVDDIGVRVPVEHGVQ
jgi:T-complex protein 1 subunit alpha